MPLSIDQPKTSPLAGQDDAAVAQQLLRDVIDRAQAQNLLFNPTTQVNVPNLAFRPDYVAPPPVAPIQESYLEKGVSALASPFVSNEKTKQQVAHYGSEFLKTASLFAAGRVGFAGAFLVYGLDQASPSQSAAVQAADFALGGLKGTTMKALFSAVGAKTSFAPAKGALMGITARSTDILFSRQAFSQPGNIRHRLATEALDGKALLMDAAIFTVGEGLFAGINAKTGGLIANNRTASGMVMGGSFGFVNGTMDEGVRQLQAGEPFNAKDVLLKGALEAGVGSAAAGFGIKASDPQFHAQLRRTTGGALDYLGLNPRPGSRDFVLTDGKAEMERFTKRQTATAIANVREIRRFLGFERLGAEKQVVVNNPTDAAGTVPLRTLSELVATAQPEKFGAPVRPSEMFPQAKGPIFLQLGKPNRMRLSIYDAPSGAGTPRLIADHPRITINAMAPLMIGNPANPGEPGHPEWSTFENHLSRAKAIGINGISTDVWWGVVEPRRQDFQWRYYDHLSTRIMANGLKWMPILSLHQAGGNVGDTVHIPVPFWVWNKLATSLGSSNPDIAKFVSEQGNVSHEYVSFWATEQALPYYSNVMAAFRNRYAGKAHAISEINVSLGPAGEARYPSYNSHDSGAGFPSRGALQAYSELARQSFYDFVMQKYGDQAGIGRAWGPKFIAEPNIEPPRNPEAFFRNGDHHNTQYGRDFFDWYSGTLISHSQKVMGKALEVFNAPEFQHVEIGAKIPGVHWRVGSNQGGNIVLGDRLAELSAGLIRTSGNDWHSDEAGRGYRPLLAGFKELTGRPGGDRLVLHFTCLELVDGHDGAAAQALPYSLARWVGREARHQGLTLKGENALNWTLPNPESWHRMQSHLDIPGQSGYYRGLTILRLSDIFASETALWHILKMIEAANSPASGSASAR